MPTIDELSQQSTADDNDKIAIFSQANRATRSLTISALSEALKPAIDANTADAIGVFGGALSAASGAALVGFQQAGIGAIMRTTQDKLRDTVSVKDFGAKGDAVTDDRAAIIFADAACYAAGKVLHFPASVYRCGDGIPNKKANWTGAGAPVMGTFPIVDDKRFLAPSTKAQIPGTTLLFTGAGTQRATTQRSDEFASFSYCVKTAPGIPSSIDGMAIVQDMNVYDANGALTTIATDQRAGYEVGYMVDMSPRCQHTDFVVFGYFAKAGTVVHTVLQTGLDNPDYCSFIGGSTSGNIGLALLGSQSDDGVSAGLSGTNFTSFEIFAKDHHSRDKTADDWGKACLYIDGYTSAVANDINGHFFTNCLIRTYGNNPLILDHASHVQFASPVFETSLMGTPNSSATQCLATSNTNDVLFLSGRYSNDAGLYNAQFAGSMAGQLIAVGGPFTGVIVTEKDPNSTTPYSARIGGASGGSGDPAIQLFAGSPSLSTAGWSIRLDVDQAENLDIRRAGVSVANIDTSGVASFKRQKDWPATTLTASAGAITVTQCYHVIDATGSPSITTINGGVEGELLKLGKTGAGTVTLAEGGNIVTPGTSVALTAVSDTLRLVKRLGNWCVESFSDNA